jgi:phosphonopyruvate decarboxylase
VQDEPQHVAQGRVMTDLLDAVGLPYDILDSDSADYASIVAGAAVQIAATMRPRALLIRKGTFGQYTSTRAVAASLACTREEAIEAVLSVLRPDDLVVSTTGLTSRGVFAYRERQHETHARDFLSVGSMGHASQIALGLAAHQPRRRVVCLDGDGAVLMHMGSLSIIGTQAPANLTHVVINNGAHDSVGGQSTAARELDLAAIAAACGYPTTARAAETGDISRAVTRLLDAPRPSFLEVLVNSQPNSNPSRPTTTPIDNKTAFMNALRDES